MKIAQMATLIGLGLLVSTAACSSAAEQGDDVGESEGAATATERGATCLANETTVFSCRTTNAKVVSICASSDISAQGGSLQYRFGTAKKAELELPATADARQFRNITTVSMTNPDVSGSFYATSATFTKGAYAYSVFYHVGHGDEGEGVTVLKNGSEVTTIECDGDGNTGLTDWTTFLTKRAGLVAQIDD